MTTKDARLELEQANTWLRQAVENALEMKAAASEIPASLQRIADCLNSVASEPIEEDAHFLRPQLDVLQSRMRQLQTLLDSAAAFYCASIAHNRASDGDSYTAKGNRLVKTGTHQLEVRA